MEIKKTLLILKSQPRSLGLAEGFLHNRGWEIKSTTSLEEAMLHFVQHHPCFTLVSTDHENPRALKLLQNLARSYETCMIAYTEKTSVTSMITIDSMGADYSLTPPITGPAIERIVHKYQKDLKDKPKPIMRGLSGQTFTVHGQPQEEQTKFETLMSYFSSEALETCCTHLEDENSDYDSLNMSSRVACVRVESTSFTGYIVVALANDRPLDYMLIENIRSRIFSHLRQSGFHMRIDESMNIEIQAVPFEEFALTQGSLLAKSVHEGEEIAIAFFPREGSKMVSNIGADQDLVAVGIEEFAGNTQVHFNIYLHLERNKKFVLYVPRGGTFMETQRERLATQGVSELYIPKSETKEFDKYSAQNFLNGKIKEFEAQYS